MTRADLPALNALLNGASAVLLGLGFYFIRRGQRIAHRNCMIAAIITSALFLAGYLTYHFTVKSITRFLHPEWFRPVYLTILITHTILATVILPLILVTLARAVRGRFEAHQRLARWTWPLWLYVSVTGVLIYLLLYKIFPQP
jgi:putative membrane protein